VISFKEAVEKIDMRGKLLMETQFVTPNVGYMTQYKETERPSQALQHAQRVKQRETRV